MENFSPCGDATGREEMAGRLGLFEDALFFASCAMGFAGGKTFCVVIGRRKALRLAMVFQPGIPAYLPMLVLYRWSVR